jgi:hypothetical protein
VFNKGNENRFPVPTMYATISTTGYAMVFDPETSVPLGILDQDFVWLWIFSPWRIEHENTIW